MSVAHSGDLLVLDLGSGSGALHKVRGAAVSAQVTVEESPQPATLTAPLRSPEVGQGCRVGGAGRGLWWAFPGPGQRTGPGPLNAEQLLLGAGSAEQVPRSLHAASPAGPPCACRRDAVGTSE